MDPGMLILLFSCALLLRGAVGQDVRLPPSIIQGPTKEWHDYRDDDDYILNCTASGIPSPTYSWLKNGTHLTDHGGRIARLDNGTIQVRGLGTLDEGSYQCLATNEYGTAMSRNVVLRRAILAQYPMKEINDVGPILQGSNCTLRCLTTKWYPKPVFSWTLTNDLEDKTEQLIHPSQRMQIDEDGNLHFSYVLPEDAQNGRLYKCRLFNNILDVTIGGSYARLNVVPVPFVQPFAPFKLFSTPSPLVALEGRQLTMRCFFSGSPDPSISWSKEGASLPIRRYAITNKHSEIEIRDLVPSDEGNYRCTGQNTQAQNVFETIAVRIEAIPVFRLPSHRPQSLNVTEGDTVEINCTAYGKPVPEIKWFRNGEPLDPENLPKKFRLSDNSELLTVSDVCKECPDGSSDLMVVQCRSSNVHGYAFADGYINVLRKTRITVPPENITMDIDKDRGAFVVEGETDAITSLAHKWYREDANGEDWIAVYADEPYVEILDNGTRLQFYLPHNTTRRATYRGMYECRVGNSYSSESAFVYLDTEALPPPPPPVAPSHAGLDELWWIIVVVAGVFLLFLLLLLCCVCCYRNRGDVYPVDKKERRGGHDPEKELADSGFSDYRRPEAELIKESRVSLNSSMSISDEEASLNEYGNIDKGKFTEEGAFMGDYEAPESTQNNHHGHPNKA